MNSLANTSKFFNRAAVFVGGLQAHFDLPIMQKKNRAATNVTKPWLIVGQAHRH